MVRSSWELSDLIKFHIEPVISEVCVINREGHWGEPRVGYTHYVSTHCTEDYITKVQQVVGQNRPGTDKKC